MGIGVVLAVDATAVALLGLGSVPDDRRPHARRHREGRGRARHVLWFALLFALSTELNDLGFMAFLGQKLRSACRGCGAVCRRRCWLLAYVLLHYLFVSQTAHLLAMFGAFLDVGVRVGVPAMPLAFLLLFATNFFSRDHAAGVERQPAVRQQRLPVAA